MLTLSKFSLALQKRLYDWAKNKPLSHNIRRVTFDNKFDVQIMLLYQDTW